MAQQHGQVLKDDRQVRQHYTARERELHHADQVRAVCAECELGEALERVDAVRDAQLHETRARAVARDREEEHHEQCHEEAALQEHVGHHDYGRADASGDQQHRDLQ